MHRPGSRPEGGGAAGSRPEVGGELPDQGGGGADGEQGRTESREQPELAVPARSPRLGHPWRQGEKPV